MTDAVIPEKTVERLCSYRRILLGWQERGKERFYSHDLAAEASITSAQVRRDLMSLRTIGTPRNGYVTANIVEELGLIIEGESEQKIVLVGAGNLGKAILDYFAGRRPNLRIIAAFEKDPAKIGKRIASTPCLPIGELAGTVRENDVLLGILTVPERAAQESANALVDSGVRAIINFTPAKVRVPADVYLENVDISIALEKSAYFGRVFARTGDARRGQARASSNNNGGAKGEPMMRILCIEDDRDILESYQAILHGAGYEVETALDGETGLASARARKPDLIILDVMMRESTEGFHVAYQIRQDPNLKHVPILMLTAISSEFGMRFDKEKDGAYLPVDAFVDKPVAPQSLLSAVKRLLALPANRINVDGTKK
ncbi:MAG: redox-sensing transcriptional repressor Rex [Candidatus Latescibacterota bacterium]|nr:MAG: redox-sensing transcriptional repressor Rex [Candidatus Latescibacterota bacterium]